MCLQGRGAAVDCINRPGYRKDYCHIRFSSLFNVRYFHVLQIPKLPLPRGYILRSLIITWCDESAIYGCL